MDSPLKAVKTLVLSRLAFFWVALSLVSVGASRSVVAQSAPESEPLPITGRAVPGMEEYDRRIPALMRKYNVPGGSVAVMCNDRLVFARGYGYADRDAREVVQPGAIFRVASLSKPLTAMAVLLLVQRGRLSLDDRAFDVLEDLRPLAFQNEDPRLHSITIRQLLTHSGGWDRRISIDPLFEPYRIAAAARVAVPPDVPTIVRYMRGQPLQFDPGARYTYSNFGYTVLGRVIEKVSGQSYEQFVKSSLLEPSGAMKMRLGRSRLEQRAPGEVRYYDPPGMPLSASVFDETQAVTTPYGSASLEARDSCAGWLSSPSDYLRFVAALDGLPERHDLFSPATLNAVAEPPSYARELASYWGLGWQIKVESGGLVWQHGGMGEGTRTLVVKTPNGLAWAAFFNANPGGEAFSKELSEAMWQMSREIKAWPSIDLFEADATPVAQG